MKRLYLILATILLVASGSFAQVAKQPEQMLQNVRVASDNQFKVLKSQAKIYRNIAKNQTNEFNVNSTLNLNGLTGDAQIIGEFIIPANTQGYSPVTIASTDANVMFALEQPTTPEEPVAPTPEEPTKNLEELAWETSLVDVDITAEQKVYVKYTVPAEEPVNPGLEEEPVEPTPEEPTPEEPTKAATHTASFDITITHQPAATPENENPEAIVATITVQATLADPICATPQITGEEIVETPADPTPGENEGQEQGEEQGTEQGEENNNENTEPAPATKAEGDIVFVNGMTITITCETEGAAIYYTLDGTDPTEASLLYNAEDKPVVTTNTTVKAIAIKAGHENSEIASQAFAKQLVPFETPQITGTPIAENTTPAEEGENNENEGTTPSEGEGNNEGGSTEPEQGAAKTGEANTFTYKMSIEIATSTPADHIYYTTDGSEPTAESTEYTAAFEIEATTTVKAIAVKEGFLTSAVASQTFTKEEPVVEPITIAAPTFNPTETYFDDSIRVAINCETAGVTIKYVFGEVTATSEWLTYTDTLTLRETTIINAKAILGTDTSAVATATYTKNAPVPPTVVAPTFTPNGGNFTDSVLVAINCETAGVTIKYVFGEVTATSEWLVYSDTLVIRETTTITAKAILAETESATATATFTKQEPVVVLDTVATPTFTPAAGEYTEAQSVVIACATEGAAIYYTTNGDAPTAQSTRYENAIAVEETTTIKAIAIKEGMENSLVATAEYVINIPALPVVETPVITGTDGATTFEANIQVTITCATEGAAIYYTTDNSDPTAESTLYEAAFTITETTIVKAIAVKDSMQNSAIANVTFTKVGADVAWSCDFEGPVVWTFGHTEGKTDQNWIVGDSIAYFETTLYDPEDGGYMMPMTRAIERFGLEGYETPTKWAFVDMLAGTTNHPLTDIDMESWIAFSEINLEDVDAPRLIFNQIWRPFQVYAEVNSTYVDVSINGGATWATHHVNAINTDNAYYYCSPQEVLIPEAANQRNVSIRFRVISKNSLGTQSGFPVGMGWQIDDIKIVPTPPCNLTLQEGRMNFFGYYAYDSVPWLEAQMTGGGFTSLEEVRDLTYQYFGPYARTPKYNWVYDGYITNVVRFNVEVINNGADAIRPVANVKVISPSNNVIFDKNVTCRQELASGMGDTINFAYINAENIEDPNNNVFFFMPDQEVELGRYTVEFTVNAADDADTSDNKKTQYFEITENQYSLAFEEVSSRSALANWNGTQTGDEIGVDFPFAGQPDGLLFAEVYIDEECTPGTSMQSKLYVYDEEADDYLNRVSSSIITVTEEMLGTWVRIEFEDEYEVVLPEDGSEVEARLAIKCIWDSDDDDLLIGTEDKIVSRNRQNLIFTNNSGRWGTVSDKWAIKLVNSTDVSAPTFVMEDITMYPNPTSGIVNFENVEGATIEVINVMGQVVATANSNSSNASMDLSGISNGNYVVRIVKDGNIATSKLNIVR